MVVCSLKEASLVFGVDINSDIVFSVVQVLSESSQHLSAFFQQNYSQDDSNIAIEFYLCDSPKNFEQKPADVTMPQNLHQNIRINLLASKLALAR